MGRQVNVAMIQTFCDLYQKTRKKSIKIIIGAQVHYKKYQKKSVRKYYYLLIRVTDRSFFSISACKLFCPTYSITIMPWFCSLSDSVSSITCLIFVTFSWCNFKAFNSFVREVLCFMIFTATRSPTKKGTVQICTRLQVFLMSHLHYLLLWPALEMKNSADCLLKAKWLNSEHCHLTRKFVCLWKCNFSSTTLFLKDS